MFMSSVSALPDSNPTRAQLRLVVLGQWVRAGLALARGPQAGRGFIGGVVALWRVFQAVRLAIQLAQRLSELRGARLFDALGLEPGDRLDQDLVSCSDGSSVAAAWLHEALGEIQSAIHDALGLAQDRYARPQADKAGGVVAKLEVSHTPGRPTPPRGLPPERPPGPGPGRWRRPARGRRMQTAPTPIATLAVGRFRLAAA
jgi:hypothetical protein